MLPYPPPSECATAGLPSRVFGPLAATTRRAPAARLVQPAKAPQLRDYLVVAEQLGKPVSDCLAVACSEVGWHVACVVQRGDKQLVVIDGQEVSREYADSSDPVFSRDGRRVAYVARKGGRSFVMLDGQEGPEDGSIVENGPAFRDDGTLEYLATRTGYTTASGTSP